MIDKNSLTVRKALWLAQRRYPFIDRADVLAAAKVLLEPADGEEEPAPNAHLTLTAQDLADFVCEIVESA